MAVAVAGSRFSMEEKQMPNIEIHGFHEAESRELNTRAKALIEASFPQAVCDEAVVTVCKDHVTDFRERPKPFLRVLSSDADEAKRIAEILSSHGFDTEFMHIGFMEGKT